MTLFRRPSVRYCPYFVSVKIGSEMSKSGGNDGLRYARTQDAAGVRGGALGI